MPCEQILCSGEKAQPCPLLESDATAGSEILCQHQHHNLATQDELTWCLPSVSAPITDAERGIHSMQPFSLTNLTGSDQSGNTSA